MHACVCYVYGCVSVGVLCSLIALNIFQTGVTSIRWWKMACYVYGCVSVGVLCSLIALNIFQTGVTSLRWWKMAYRNRSDNHWKCNWSDTQQSILLLTNTLLHLPSTIHMHAHTYACSLACMYTYTHPVIVCAVFMWGGGGGRGQLENNSQFIWLIVADYFSSGICWSYS